MSMPPPARMRVLPPMEIGLAPTLPGTPLTTMPLSVVAIPLLM